LSAGQHEARGFYRLFEIREQPFGLAGSERADFLDHDQAPSPEHGKVRAESQDLRRLGLIPVHHIGVERPDVGLIGPEDRGPDGRHCIVPEDSFLPDDQIQRGEVARGQLPFQLVDADVFALGLHRG